MQEYNENQQPVRVLLVEDNAPTSRAMAQLLRLEGAEVQTAPTLSSGRESLRRSSADWVLLDLMLPDGDGETLLSEIREHNLPVRVAILTGISDRSRLKRVQELEPELLMPKPFDPDSLLRAMMLPQSD